MAENADYDFEVPPEGSKTADSSVSRRRGAPLVRDPGSSRAKSLLLRWETIGAGYKALKMTFIGDKPFPPPKLALSSAPRGGGGDLGSGGRGKVNQADGSPEPAIRQLPSNSKKKGGGIQRNPGPDRRRRQGAEGPRNEYNHVFRRLATCEPSHRLDLGGASAASRRPGYRHFLQPNLKSGPVKDGTGFKPNG